jgi:4-oxalocrotonate tautomerase
MPIVRIEMYAGRSREQKREIAEVFTRELVRIARCTPQSVQVVFVEADKGNWAVGGVLADEVKPG